jgi:hypothetical protein
MKQAIIRRAIESGELTTQPTQAAGVLHFFKHGVRMGNTRNGAYEQQKVNDLAFRNAASDSNVLMLRALHHGSKIFNYDTK